MSEIMDLEQKEGIMEDLDAAKALREQTQSDLVRILSDGQQLKLDIHHLREEFQSLLSGVKKFDNIKELPALSPPKPSSDRPQSVQKYISEAVNYHINTTDASSKRDNNLSSSPVKALKSTSSQVGVITDCVATTSPSVESSVKSSPTSTRQLPVVLDTPTSSRIPNIALRLDRKAHSASKSLRRYSEQLPPRQALSASKISSKRRYSSAANKYTRNSRDCSENTDPANSPAYQVLTVRDSPSSENSDSVRAIYKNHKKRLMARRESGDGAPSEWVPNKYARLSSAGQTPSQSLLSPMRRLPIRDYTGPSANTQVIDPYSAAAHWSRPQSVSTRRYDDNSDRLRPKFFSMKSSGSRANNVPSPVDPLSQPRPSPEGLLGSAERRPVQRCSCRRPDCDVTSPQNATPFARFTQPENVQQNRYVQRVATKQPKISNRYKKQQFPKTPVVARDMQYPLETIDEHGLVHIVMTPEHYNQHVRHMYGGAARDVTSLHRQAVATSSLLAGYPSHSNMHARKNTTTALKDISQISHVAGNVREQPSSLQLQGDLHSSFDYPLHSTMSYPLHSTMRNAELFPEADQDMSSINVASPGTPTKEAPKRPLKPAVSQSQHEDQSQEITKTKREVYSNPKVAVSTRHSVDSVKTLQGIGYKSVNEAEGINMETFSYDEGVLNTTPVNNGQLRVTSEQPVPLPRTPAHVISSYYTLSYDSDVQTPTPEDGATLNTSDSECDSSFFSIDPDSTVNPRRASEELTLVTPTANPPTCHHHGTVTCRCHVKSVRRVRPFENLLSDVTRAQLERPAPIGLSESTVFMDSQLREISPMEVDQSSLSMPHTSNTITRKSSSRHTRHSVSKQTSMHPSTSDSKDTQNDSHSSNNSSKSNGHDARGNLDFMSNLCHSIESIDDLDSLDAPKSSFKSSVNSAKTVIEVKPVPVKSKFHVTKSDRDIMAQTHVESNCLNLGKLLSMKDNKAKYAEKMVVNRTLMANQNVTMVADGCLGFLRKKKPSTNKKEAKPPKSRKLRIRGSKIKPDTDNFDDAENKENAPSKAFRVRLPETQSLKVAKSAISESTRSYRMSFTEVNDQASVVSSSIGPGCMGHEMKRKLSKRMKEFRRSTFSESQRMSQQHMGHV